MLQRNTKIFYITQIFHSLIFVIPIWVVFYQRKISAAEISYTVTIQYIAQMIFELPSGALADLIGRRLTNVLGWTALICAYILFPYAETFVHFALLGVVLGFSDSCRSGAEEALIYDTYKEANQEKQYDKVYSTGSLFYQLGLITSTALGGFMYEINQYLPFFAYAFCAICGMILTFFYIEPSIDSDKFTIRNYIHQIKIGSREAFKNTSIKYLSIFYITVASITWSSALYFNSFMMVELGFEDKIRGILTAMLRLINILTIRFILTNKKIFTWERRIVFFPIIMILGYLPGFFVNKWIGLPFVQLIMLSSTARWILLSPLINKAIVSKYRATAISFLSLLVGIIYIIITTASAPIISHYGVKSMHSLLGILTIILVIPIATKVIIQKKISKKI